MIRGTRKSLVVLTVALSLILLLYSMLQCWIKASLPRSLLHPLPLLTGQPLPELIPRPHSLWVIETSGRSNLNPRELCTVESAALHHYDSTVYIGFTSPWKDKDVLLEQLLSNYSNIQPRYLDLDTLFSTSSLSSLWFSGKIHSSYWPVSHLSDVLRYFKRVILCYFLLILIGAFHT